MAPRAPILLVFIAVLLSAVAGVSEGHAATAIIPCPKSAAVDASLSAARGRGAYWLAMYNLVYPAFEKSNFAYLEKLAAQLRNGRSCAPRGKPGLGYFYGALDYSDTGNIPADDRVLTERERIAEDWARKYPQSPTPYIVLAKLTLDHAWIFRGTGYSREVSSAAFDTFEQMLKQASDTLTENKAIASTDPQWYIEMLRVALGQNWKSEDFKALIVEGGDRFPYYTNIYEDSATFYLPQWNGSVDVFHDYVEEVLHRTRKLYGNQEYARIYQKAEGWFLGRSIFTAARASWPRMYESYMEIEKAYPDDDIWNDILYSACLAGDRPAARLAIKRAPALFWSSPQLLQRCKAWAAGTDSIHDVLNMEDSQRTDVGRALFGSRISNILPAWFGTSLIWYVVFLVSLMLHEKMRAYVAAKFGASPNARGWAAINPLPYAKRALVGIVIFPIISLLLFGGTVGWAEKTVDETWAEEHPRAAALAALAGFAVSLFVTLAAGAAICWSLSTGRYVFPDSVHPTQTIVGAVTGYGDAWTALIGITFATNMILVVLNVLPVPPLDASKALALVMSKSVASRYVKATQTRFATLYAALAAFMVGEILFEIVYRWSLPFLLPPR